jgi:hypothetical protein
MAASARIALIALSPLALGCFEPREDLTDVLDYQGPGSEAWGDDDINCDNDADCLTGEACLDAVCQLDKCNTGLSDSISPIGMGLTFLQNKDIGLADATSYQGSYWVDGYGGRSGTPYDYSWDAGSTAITDIGGGDFYGTRPENYVVALAGQSKVTVLTASGAKTQSLGYIPVAVSAGDVDGDGLDEVLAVASTDTFSVCHMDEGGCDTWEFEDSGFEMLDITAGDIDGDGRAEPILLFDWDGGRYLYAVNTDAEEFGQEITEWVVGWEVDDGPRSVSAGDLDGDMIAEVVGLWDGEWLGWYNAEIRTFSAITGEDGGELALAITHELETDYAVDLTVGDSDMDDASEIYVLTEEGQIEKVVVSSTGTASTLDSSDPSVSSSPQRIALADHDGDSPRANLIGDTQACTGNTIPTILMMLPPYDKDHSNGVSGAAYGDSEDVWEAYSDTVSLGMSVDVGYKASFGDLFGAELSTKLSMGVSRTLGIAHRKSVGSRYSISAQPELYGSKYGAVVVSWGCFDGYTYELDDPEGYIDDDGGEFVMTIPTGGGVTLLSTQRYNAMSDVIDGLPRVDIPYTVGDVSSYPTSPETLDGGTLDSSNLLFTDAVSYAVSDVGKVSWRMYVAKNVTNSVQLTQDIGISAGVTVGGVSVGVGASYGWGQGYSLMVGESAFFNGTIPPLPDDLDTPEDEYSRYAYQVTPYLYVQDYEDAGGNDASYYVMTYTATQ